MTFVSYVNINVPNSLSIEQVSGCWVRTDPWDTGFVDLAGDQGLLGQIEGRTGAVVRQWLGEPSEAFRAGVTHVVIDPSAAYAAAVTTEVLPLRRAGRRPLPSGQARQRRADRGAPAGHLRRLPRAWPQTRPGVGQPPPTLDSARTSGAQIIHLDVECLDRQRSELSNPVRVHRQRGTAPAARGCPRPRR